MRFCYLFGCLLKAVSSIVVSGFSKQTLSVEALQGPAQHLHEVGFSPNYKTCNIFTKLQKSVIKPLFNMAENNPSAHLLRSRSFGILDAKSEPRVPTT